MELKVFKMEFKNIAIEKLTEEIKEINGNIQTAISNAVKDTLISFCTQEEEFAQAIAQSDKTYQECLNFIADGVGSSISDIKAYRKAVEFYFSTATVKFNMTIDLCGNTEKSVLNLSFDDLFDI